MSIVLSFKCADRKCPYEAFTALPYFRIMEILHTPTMKRFLIVLVLLFSSLPFASKASHILGGDIQYKYVGDSTGVANQYRVKLVIYWANAPVGFDPGASQNVTIVAPSCNINTSMTVTRPGAAFPASNIGAFDCIAQATSPFNPMVNVYYGYVILPQVCNDYKFYWQTCCRSAGITALSNSSGLGFYFEAELNNTLGANKSPIFVSIPLAYICVGGYTNYLQNAIELDGDSINYELVPARQFGGGTGTPVPYSAPYTYTNPVSTAANGPFLLNSQTGNITFVASQAMSSVIGIRVNEYRFDSLYGYWEKVGSANREIQVTVAGACLPIVNAGVKLKYPSPGVSLDSKGRQVRQYNCLDSAVMLRFTIPVEMASVSPDGSDFRLTAPNGQPIPIAKLQGYPDFNGETDSLLVKLTKPLSLNGDYFLYSKVGMDGNTLLNKCGKDMNEFDTIILKVNDCVNLDMTLTDVTIDNDLHPHLYWHIDPQTFPQYLFNLYRIYRSGDGGGSWLPIASLNDSAARDFVDVQINATDVDMKSYRYYVQMILNSDPMPPTNAVQSIWLRGDLTNAESVPVVWRSYNGWNPPRYQIQWGTNLGVNTWIWQDYGSLQLDTTATVLHPNVPPGLYAVRIRSVRNMNINSIDDTTFSNWIIVGEPVPPIPPIDSVIVPNVITPNGDGVNDGFIIRGLMSYTSDRTVKIFNRWGTLVYESLSYDNATPWDGRDKGGQRVPAGVYFYIVDAYDAPNNTPPAFAGRRRRWNGNVTVLQQ